MAQGQFLTRFLSLFGNSTQAGLDSRSGGDPEGDGPRDHHYYFAHHYLPAKASEDARTLVERLHGDLAMEYLTSLWESSRSEIVVAEDVVIPTSHLTCFPVALDAAHSGVVVQLPQPTKTLEAYFAAVILNTASSVRNDHRYFTLELADGFDGPGRTVLCEWKDGRHINHGDGPEPECRSFIRHLEQFL